MIQASKAKELVIKRALEKEEAELRKLSILHRKNAKTIVNSSPESCISKDSSLIGIRLLDDSSNLSRFELQMQENIPPNKINGLDKEPRYKAKAPPTLHSTKRAKERAEFQSQRLAFKELRRSEREKKRQAILKEKKLENNKLRNLL